MTRRPARQRGSRERSTIRELKREEEQFDRWNSDDERIFGLHHEWRKLRSYEDGRDVVVQCYKCSRCNSEHAVRFYSNGLRIDVGQAGDCDEVVIKSVQEG